MSLEDGVTMAILLAFYILGCYFIDRGDDPLTRLEIKAALSTKDPSLMYIEDEARHDALYAEFLIFKQKNLISYEDYLRLVITYGTVHLI